MEAAILKTWDSSAIRSTEDRQEFLILDSEGTPIGTIRVPEGMIIDEINIMGNLVPIGVNAPPDDVEEELETEPSENPRTNDRLVSRITAMVILVGAYGVLMISRKKLGTE